MHPNLGSSVCMQRFRGVRQSSSPNHCSLDVIDSPGYYPIYVSVPCGTCPCHRPDSYWIVVPDMHGAPPKSVRRYPSGFKQLELNTLDMEDVASVMLGNGLHFIS